MPELPEVEEVRRTLAPCLLRQTVVRVQVRHPKYVRAGRAAQPTPLAVLCGQSVEAIRRHGKKLFVHFGKGDVLVLHLGMSGRISCVKPGRKLQPHTHLCLTLDSGQEIRMMDPRRFGGVWYYTSATEAHEAEVDGCMGVDALDLECEHLAHWRSARGRLKARLLGQRDVAGLGNIYVDEALWMAQLHPRQRVCRIRDPQLEALVAAIRGVLHSSIALGGTTLKDYRNVRQQAGTFARQLRAYGRAGQPCARCGQKLTGCAVAGRTTVYCSHCQKCR